MVPVHDHDRLDLVHEGVCQAEYIVDIEEQEVGVHLFQQHVDPGDPSRLVSLLGDLFLLDNVVEERHNGLCVEEICGGLVLQSGLDLSRLFGQKREHSVEVAVRSALVILQFGQHTHKRQVEICPNILVHEGILFVECILDRNIILILEDALVTEETVVPHELLDLSLVESFVFQFG